jgi:hypothetical protein
MLNEIIQAEKNKYPMVSLMWNLKLYFFQCWSLGKYDFFEMGSYNVAQADL